MKIRSLILIPIEREYDLALNKEGITKFIAYSNRKFNISQEQEWINYREREGEKSNLDYSDSTLSCLYFLPFNF